MRDINDNYGLGGSVFVVVGAVRNGMVVEVEGAGAVNGKESRMPSTLVRRCDVDGMAKALKGGG